ncbi:MAG: nucleotide sugar dehydrogenase [Candidatus Binatia bacterium]|jgi:UDP-N-acetyl-D-glucosamine dehydrogenase
MGQADELKQRLASNRATVGVIGLGYVGLPLALTMVEAGKRVVGLDVDGAKVERLGAGQSYIRHIAASRIVAAGERFRATSDFRALEGCDAVIVCVPTPLTEGREPDLSYVSKTAETIAEHLRPGQLVVLESTTYPGTTEEVMQPILERGGLRVGRDYHLAFSPEREDPGNPRFNTKSIPKLVGGVTAECGEVARALYGSFLEKVVVVSSARVAESAKLLENIYRSINIALVNELKMLFERMGIDVWEVIEAAGTKPFGFTPFYPGPGLGGHCIPIDPFYLTWKARHYDFSTRFIELAGEVNTGMPYWVVEKVVEALNQGGKAINGAKVLVLGMAYKKDVDDLRESPSLKVIEILESRGAEVSYNDPYVPSLRARKLRHYETFELDSVELTESLVAEADCVLIATDHTAYDYDWIVQHARCVVDTRNATKSVRQGRDKIVKA